LDASWFYQGGNLSSSRAAGDKVPIILLTAKDEVSDRVVKELDETNDVIKPFHQY